MNNTTPRPTKAKAFVDELRVAFNADLPGHEWEYPCAHIDGNGINFNTDNFEVSIDFSQAGDGLWVDYIWADWPKDPPPRLIPDMNDVNRFHWVEVTRMLENFVKRTGQYEKAYYNVN